MSDFKYTIIGHIDKLLKADGRNVLMPVLRDNKMAYFLQKINSFTGEVIDYVKLESKPNGLQNIKNPLKIKDNVARVIYRQVNGEIVIWTYWQFLGQLFIEFDIEKIYSPDPQFYFETCHFFQIPKFREIYEKEYVNFLKTKGLRCSIAQPSSFINLDINKFNEIFGFYNNLVNRSNGFLSFNQIMSENEDYIFLGKFGFLKEKIDAYMQKLKTDFNLLECFTREAQTYLPKTQIKEVAGHFEPDLVTTYEFDNYHF